MMKKALIMADITERQAGGFRNRHRRATLCAGVLPVGIPLCGH